MASSKKLPVWKKVLFAVVVLLVFLFFAESYARIKTYLDTGNVKYFYSSPHGAHRFGVGPLPYRGKEVTEKKPANVFRIAALGGSTTFGWGIELDSNTWPARLETILNEHFTDTRIEVINFGRPHATSTVVLEKLLPLARRYRPDYYILFSGYNDYDKALRVEIFGQREDLEKFGSKRRETGSNFSEGGNADGFSREDFLERVTIFFLRYSIFAHRMRELIAKVWYKDIAYFYKRERKLAKKPTVARKRLRTSGEKKNGPDPGVEIRTLPFQRKITIDLEGVLSVFRKNIRRIIDEIRDDGTDVMLMTLPVQWNHPGARHILERGSLGALNTAIRELSVHRKNPFCDIGAAFMRHQNPSQLFIWDYSHPDANGARLIAKMLATCFKENKISISRSPD